MNSSSEVSLGPQPSQAEARKTQRIISLDQFRGYTVVGMFLVNFVGGFAACHYVLQHHNTFCSYADTIMPQFLFAVGFAFRLTFGRRVRTEGIHAAYLRIVKRLLGLILVALVVYRVDPVAKSWNELVETGIWDAIKVPLKRDWFQTLMHIAVTSLWILPVIRASARVRIAYLLGSAALHVVLSYIFYFRWVNGLIDGSSAIDGGPLGFLTWCIPTIVGTLACDAIADARGRPRLDRLVAWAVLLMGLGYIMSCATRLYDVPVGQVEARAEQRYAEHPVIPGESQWADAMQRVSEEGIGTLLAEPPFTPPPHPEGHVGRSYLFRKWNYWMMSQRSGSISYQTFSAGFSLAVYVLFYVLCDILGWRVGIFRTFGMNALAAYVLHMIVDSAVSPFAPRDAAAWYMWAACFTFMLITYLLVRSLEKRDIYIKV